jgi:hypothetical protein
MSNLFLDHGDVGLQCARAFRPFLSRILENLKSIGYCSTFGSHADHLVALDETGTTVTYTPSTHLRYSDRLLEKRPM